MSIEFTGLGKQATTEFRDLVIKVSEEPVETRIAFCISGSAVYLKSLFFD